MFTRLKDFLFGTQLDPALACKCCGGAVGVIDHHPIRVCARCWSSAWEARRGHDYARNGLDPWQKIISESEVDAHRLVRRMMTSPTTLRSECAAEIGIEATALYSEATHAYLAGRTHDGRELEAQATDLKQRVEELDRGES